MFDFENIFNKYKDSGDFLVTFQDVKLTNDMVILNNKCYKSYDWLKERIGYYPIWTMKVTKHYRSDFYEFKRLLGASLSTTRRYMYIIDPKKLDGFDTYLYAWCDVHLIENDGCHEESDYEVKDRYDKDWRMHLSNPSYFKHDDLEIQTLLRSINDDAIIECFKNSNH